MNCKPGDLARYVGKERGAYGFVFVVVGPGGPTEDAVNPAPGQWWEISPPVFVGGRERRFCADVALRPIRPGDGEDEMLRIVGKPKEVAA